MSFIGDSPNVKRLKLEPLSADPANPEDGDIQYSDGTARTEGFWGYNNGTWIQLDAGVAGLSDIQNTFSEGFQPFVARGTKIAVPDTEIVNRAFITDPSATGKPLNGAEVISTSEFAISTSEYGPNNQKVWKCQDERVRFVGNNWAIQDNSSGRRLQTDGVSDFIEITFYGTGVSMISSPHAGSARDFRVTVDGGAEGGNIYPTQSAILEGDNYFPGVELPLASGLAEGQHTVKVRYVSGGNMRATDIKVYNSRTDLRILPATTYAGGVESTRAVSTDTAVKPAAVVGTKGARVVTYQDNAGAIGQAVQEAAASQSDLSAADHSDEELTRRISWWEFGMDGSTDFTDRKGSGSLFSAAYTLADNHTQLQGQGVVGNTGTDSEGLRMNSITNKIVLNFVGTGLDVFLTCPASLDTIDVSIDGVSIGNLLTTPSTDRMSKVVSGLPAGSHTAVFTASTNLGSGPGFLDFLIYNIKKPSIPTGATELRDEMLLADYVENADVTATPSGYISQGVIRHLNMRELMYTGNYVAPNIDPFAFESGYDIRWNGSGATVRFRFFGTGAEFLFGRGDNTPSLTFTLDGSTDLSGATTSFLEQGTGLTFTAAAGTITGNSSADKFRLNISDLTLGYHEVTITVNNGNSQNIELIDVITPTVEIQPNMEKYSSSSCDTRNFDALKKDEEVVGPDLSKAKAWVVFNGSTNVVLKSFNVAAVVDEGTGLYSIFFEKPFIDDKYVFTTGGNLGQVFVQNSGEVYRDRIAMQFSNSGGSPTDPTYMTMAFFGELQDEETS